MQTKTEAVALCMVFLLVFGGCAGGRLARLEEQTCVVEERAAALDDRLDTLEQTKTESGRRDREAKALADSRLRDVEARVGTIEAIVREIEERFTTLEEALRASPLPAGTELQPEERELYDAAYIDFARGEYGIALSGFKAFVERFPSSPLADNALYWMAECFGAQQRWDEALAQYRLLRDLYPEGDKVKSSLLKEGMTLLEVGRKTEGEAVFRELLERFPRSEQARVARQQLAQTG